MCHKVGVRSASVHILHGDLADEVRQHQVEMHMCADVCCGRTTEDLPRWCQYLDGFQLAEVEQDVTSAGWVDSRFSAEAQLGSKGPSVQISSETVFQRHGPCSSSDNGI